MDMQFFLNHYIYIFARIEFAAGNGFIENKHEY